MFFAENVAPTLKNLDERLVNIKSHLINIMRSADISVFEHVYIYLKLFAKIVKKLSMN